MGNANKMRKYLQNKLSEGGSVDLDYELNPDKVLQVIDILKRYRDDIYVGISREEFKRMLRGQQGDSGDLRGIRRA